jgi:hypothetical protein
MDIVRFAAGCFLILLGIYLGSFGIGGPYEYLIPPYWGFFLLIPGIFLLWWSFQIAPAPSPDGKPVPTAKNVSVESSLPKQKQIEPIASPDRAGGVWDPKRGFLETTVRDVKQDSTLRKSYFDPNGTWVNTLRFRAELIDKDGNIKQYVQVEIECRRDQWVGSLSDGDKVRIERGRLGRDGILHSQRGRNLTTNSIFGKK